MNKVIFGFILLGLTFVCPSFSSNAQVNSSSVVYAEKVAFNAVTFKVHKLSCRWAKKCTENCIIIERKEAYKRGGIPCKVCGG